MAGKTEVKTELTLDTNADAVLQDLRQDFGALRAEVASAQSGLTNFASTLGALATRDVFMPLIRGARDFVVESFSLASGAYDAQQHIAGMMAGLGGKEWEYARGAAENLHGKFGALAIKAGVVGHAVEDAHESLRTFLGGDEAAFATATRNLENLVTISGSTGMNLQKLSTEFAQMSQGFLSVKSPVYSLLSSTGIFGTNMKTIVQDWQKLTEAERLQRLEQAFGNVAANLADAAPTASDLFTSIGEVKNAFIESFGGAFLREIIDELQSLRNEIVDGGEAFNDFAESLGHDFGKEVAGVINELIDAAKYLRENGAELADDVKDAFRFAKETIKFMVDNAKLLGVVGGVGALARNDTARGIGVDVLKGMFAKGGAAAPVAEGATKAIPTLATRAGQAIPALFSAIAAGGPPVWAATAAVTALGGGMAYLSMQASKEESQQRDRIKELMKREKERYRELHELTREEHSQRKKDMEELIALARQLGEETSQLRKFQAIGARGRANLEEHVVPYTVQAGNLARMLEEPLTNPELLATTEASAIEDITTGLREAVRTGDVEVSKAILMALLQSEKLSSTFRKTADTIGIGADGLRFAMQALEEMGHDGGYLHKHFGDILGSLETPQATVNFNGGQKFEIQQDFRDQDPDAIAVAFERRFTQAAVSRVQASTSTPFGA